MPSHVQDAADDDLFDLDREIETALMSRAEKDAERNAKKKVLTPDGVRFFFLCVCVCVCGQDLLLVLVLVLLLPLPLLLLLLPLLLNLISLLSYSIFA
jgi:hypothetical protein